MKIKFTEQLLAGSLILILMMAISETAIHSAVHHNHEHNHEHEHVEVCEDHDHGAEEEASICSHEHQCELCVLIQATTNFLPQPSTNSAFASEAEVKRVYRTEIIKAEISSAFSPRGPPRI